MIKVEILVDLNGMPVSRTEHCEPSTKAAQEWAAHWMYQMVSDGFIPEGAYVTYMLTAGVDGIVIDVVAYQHTYAEVTTE